MKYKAGDKVTVRKDLEVTQDLEGPTYDGLLFITEMASYRGKEVTISETNAGCGSRYYRIEGQGGLYGWTDAMFEEPVEEC